MAKAQVMDSIHITLGFILKGFTAREIYFVLLCIFLLLCVIMYFVCIIMYFLVIMCYVYTGKLVPYLFFLQRLTYQKLWESHRVHFYLSFTSQHHFHREL